MWFLFALAAGALGKIGYDKLQAERATPVPKDVTPKPTTVLGLSAGAPRLARGEDLKAVGKTLPSPLPGVTSSAWTKFCRAMLSSPRPGGAVGVFGQMPKRLEDLGFTSAPKRVFDEKTQRMVWVCGDFKPPLTADRFKASFLAQYNAFADSMKMYADQIRRGVLKVPSDLTLSGALALLHRVGPTRLDQWATSKAKDTKLLVEKTNGIF